MSITRSETALRDLSTLVSGPEAERVKKNFQKVLKRNELGITIRCNRKTVDYLDLMLNLNDGTYKPYRKPNE